MSDTYTYSRSALLNDIKGTLDTIGSDEAAMDEVESHVQHFREVNDR